jgi:hypothetical protein
MRRPTLTGLAGGAASTPFTAAFISHGTIALITGAAVTALAYTALVLIAVLPEWFRHRTLRESGQRLQWLIARASSVEEAEKIGRLLLAQHTEMVRALAPQPDRDRAHQTSRPVLRGRRPRR